MGEKEPERRPLPIVSRSATNTIDLRYTRDPDAYRTAIAHLHSSNPELAVWMNSLAKRAANRHKLPATYEVLTELMRIGISVYAVLEEQDRVDQQPPAPLEGFPFSSDE